MATTVSVARTKEDMMTRIFPRAPARSTAYRNLVAKGRICDVTVTVASCKTDQTPPSTCPEKASHNNANGTDADVLDRMKVREICEGWPYYRDWAEWNSYCSMGILFWTGPWLEMTKYRGYEFHDYTYVGTNWKQGPIDEFIKVSRDGFEKGSGCTYISHPVTGQTVDVQGNRAVRLLTLFTAFETDAEVWDLGVLYWLGDWF